MKKNHKILLGITIGAGVAYALHTMYGGKKGNGAIVPAPVKPQDDITREQKEEYVIDSLKLTPSEEKSGFDGDRFRYDPTLGYEIPVGQVEETRASNEMILPNEGNLANEIGFSNLTGNGQSVAHKMKPQVREKVFTKTLPISADPTEEAIAILNEMTDEEVDVAYVVARGLAENPSSSRTDLLKSLGLDATNNGVYNTVIRPRLQDIKVLKKKKNWRSRWAKRRAKFASTPRVGGGRPMRPKRPRRGKLMNQIIHRTDGAMWGGHRQDGRPTIGGGFPFLPKPNLLLLHLLRQ